MGTAQLAFDSCTNLNTIFYNCSARVCTLGNSNAFSGTGITSSTGSIFVPVSLVDAYKSATNWTYFSNVIKPHVIGDPIDSYVELNNITTISIPLYCDGVLPSSVNIVSNDNSVLSVSNIQYDVENITCDITSYNIEKFENIAVAVDCNGSTFNKELMLNIGQPLAYTVDNSISNHSFILNSEGYYQSNIHTVQDTSCAVCILNIEAKHDCTMYLDCTRSFAGSSDYAIFSTLDTELSFSSSVDSENVYKLFGYNNSNISQTVSYTVPAGKHFIYIKYIKGFTYYTGNYWLKFKVRFE